MTEQGIFELDTTRGVAIQQSLRYQKPWKFLLNIGSNCWFLLWAIDPVIGVEDAQERDSRNYWQAGIEAATHIVDPPIPESEIALLIQPANRRSQHQLHIHVGRLDAAYREVLRRLRTEPDVTTEVTINGYRFFVGYLPDLPDQEPLQGHPVFDRVAQMLPDGEMSMPLYGVLVARNERGDGSWLMAAKGLTRRQLVFSTDHTCRINDTGRTRQSVELPTKSPP